MGDLIVVTGPPGAGKSTVCGLLVEAYEPSVLVSLDEFFAFIRRGAIEPWLPDARANNEMATRAGAAAAGAYVRGGASVVLDGVVGPWFLCEFVAASELASIDYVVLLPPVEVCVHRVRTRVGHGFSSEAVTRKMHGDFAATEVAAQHLVDRVYSSPAEVFSEIVRRRGNGSLRVYSDVPSAVEPLTAPASRRPSQSAG